MQSGPCVFLLKSMISINQSDYSRAFGLNRNTSHSVPDSSNLERSSSRAGLLRQCEEMPSNTTIRCVKVRFNRVIILLAQIHKLCFLDILHRLTNIAHM